MNEIIQYRQGDILLEKSPVPPSLEGATKLRRSGGPLVLAYGEATGHAHEIASGFAILFSLQNEVYLNVTKISLLTHEEHATVEIPPGVYRVIRQREYNSALHDELGNTKQHDWENHVRD